MPAKASEKIAMAADDGTMRGVSNPSGAGKAASTVTNAVVIASPMPPLRAVRNAPSTKNWVIMLVSVTERTREIGLRKALGATHRAILTQFFVEGAFLTALSGGIGLAITTALVTVLAALPAPEGFDTPRIVPSSAAIAIFSLAFAGIAAGLYPARQAALLQPVEALRQE